MFNGSEGVDSGGVLSRPLRRLQASTGWLIYTGQTRGLSRRVHHWEQRSYSPSPIRALPPLA